MIASELIDEARDYHPDFRRKFGGDKPPIRRLSRIEQAVATKLAREEPDAISVSATINNAALTTALAGTGVLTVPAYIIIPKIRGVRLASSGGGIVKVHQINRAQQYEGGAPFPSVATKDRALVLTDLRKLGMGDDHGWEDIDSIEYDYVPLPAPLVAEDQELTIPDGLGGYLVAALAEWMAARLELTTIHARAQEDRREAMRDFLDTVLLQGAGENWHVLDGSS